MSRDGLLGSPLGQFGLGAIALVIGGALLFALIGAVSGDDGDTVAAPEITDAPADTGTGADGTEDAATGAPTDATEPPATDAPDDDTGTEPTDAGTATEQAPAIDPATITIQVLDGSDDRADHEAVVACLEAAGYSDLITGHRARTTYQQTAVFYTDGGQDAAGQVASTLGIGNAEEQPGNLSTSVPVHVVTGQDGAERC